MDLFFVALHLSQRNLQMGLKGVQTVEYDIAKPFLTQFVPQMLQLTAGQSEQFREFFSTPPGPLISQC